MTTSYCHQKKCEMNYNTNQQLN